MKLLKQNTFQINSLIDSELTDHNASSSNKSNIRSLKAIMNQGRVPLAQYIKNKTTTNTSISQHLTYFDKMKGIFNKPQQKTNRFIKHQMHTQNTMQIQQPQQAQYTKDLSQNCQPKCQNKQPLGNEKTTLELYDVSQKGRSNSAMGKSGSSQQSRCKLANLMKHKKRTTELEDLTIINSQKTMYPQLQSIDKNLQHNNVLAHLTNGKPAKKQNVNYSKFTSLYDSGQGPLGLIELSETLGCGASATVRVGRDKKTGKCFAIKIYEKYKLVETSKRKRVFREMQILSKISHPNIIKITNSFEDKRQIHILFEYVDQAETLQDYLRRSLYNIPEAVKQAIALKIVEAVCFLHEAGISHRDIKTQNIIINNQGVLKLIDFGFATTLTRGQTHCGTPNYMAPELFYKNNHYDPLKVDVWALGILFYYLFEGTYPFKGYNEKDLIKNISSATVSFKKTSYQLQATIRSLLAVNPQNRPCARQLLFQLKKVS